MLLPSAQVVDLVVLIYHLPLSPSLLYLFQFLLIFLVFHRANRTPLFLLTLLVFFCVTIVFFFNELLVYTFHQVTSSFFFWIPTESMFYLIWNYLAVVTDFANPTRYSSYPCWLMLRLSLLVGSHVSFLIRSTVPLMELFELRVSSRERQGHPYCLRHYIFSCREGRARNVRGSLY